MKSLRWCVLLLVLAASPAAAQTRIKHVTHVRGAAENMLVGYGLVVGLAGTGDSTRNSVFTRQSIKSMLDKLGVGVKDEDLRTRNVAAVLVTASVAPQLVPGNQVDVTVSSLGDSGSLKGGTLVMTPLVGADGGTYAVAQGQVTVAGFDSRGQAESVSEGVPTGGRIANGAIVQRPSPSHGHGSAMMMFELKNPDAKTAVAIVDAINEYAMARFGLRIAHEDTSRAVRVVKPRTIGATRLMAEIGDLLIVPDTPAKVVIDPRSGTVVIGANVQISTVAVTYGNLSVRITEAPSASQPSPLTQGETTVVPSTTIQAQETGGHFTAVGGRSLGALIQGLNQIGVKPAGVIAILQAIKTAGALQADLVIQ